MATHARNRLAGLLACVVLALVVGCSSGGDDVSGSDAAEPVSGTFEEGKLTIAISGMVMPEEGFAYYGELGEYVAERVGLEAHLIHKSDYSVANELLMTQEVDMAFVCSGAYVAAHDEFGLELLVTPIVNGVQEYCSYTIVSESSEATSLASLEGKTFAFASPHSNAGRIVPTYMLLQMGETPESFFGRTIFTYSHGNSIMFVATGEVDGAAVDSLIWDYLDATDPEYTSGTRILFRSGPFSVPPVVVRPDMPEDLKDRLREAFLGLHEDSRGREILSDMNIERFGTIDDSAYDSIREMIDCIESQGSD